MIFQKHIPGPLLRDYIDCIIYLEGNNKGTGFPKTGMSLVFNLNDSFKLFKDKEFTRFIDYEKFWIAGFQTQPTHVESYGQSKMIVVQFKTNGAYAFLNQPLNDFTNQYVNLDLVFTREAEDVWEQITEAKSVHDKFLVTERFLVSKLLSHKISNKKLPPSIRLLLDSKVNHSIKEICRQQQISRKHLNFLFKEYLGISPKMLSSLYRFQKMLGSISRVNPEKLTSIAYDLDFYDQSHFNNNFKHFTGLKPNEYIKNIETCPTLKIVPHFLPVQ